jgi:hypothetical protein
VPAASWRLGGPRSVLASLGSMCDLGLFGCCLRRVGFDPFGEGINPAG